MYWPEPEGWKKRVFLPFPFRLLSIPVSRPTNGPPFFGWPLPLGSDNTSPPSASQRGCGSGVLAASLHLQWVVLSANPPRGQSLWIKFSLSFHMISVFPCEPDWSTYHLPSPVVTAFPLALPYPPLSSFHSRPKVFLGSLSYSSNSALPLQEHLKHLAGAL